jgi:hypothetical protein
MLPLLHNHINLEVTQFKPALRSLMNEIKEQARPKEFYESSVKSLMIPYNLDVPDAIMFLRACPKVEKLACWLTLPEPNPELVDALKNLQPRSLSIRLLNLFGGKEELPDFSVPLFQNVTHLEIIDSHAFWTPWEDIAKLPKLTHLILYSPVEWRREERLRALHRSVKFFLENCPSLQVLALNLTATENKELLKPLDDITDERLVFFQLKPQGRILWAWNCHVHGRPDIWQVCEDYVRECMPTQCKLYCRLSRNASHASRVLLS